MTTEGTEQAQKPAEETLDYDAELAKLDEEYSQEAPPEQTPIEQPPADIKDHVARLQRELDDMKRERLAEASNRDVEKTLTDIVGGSELSIEAEDARSLVYGRIANDPTKSKIYLNRGKNPSAFKKMIDLEKRWIEGRYGKKPSTETSDLEALEASVRGQHQPGPDRKTPSVKNVGKMSPHEYAKWKQEALG